MKFLFLCVLLAFPLCLSAQTPVGVGQWVVINPSTTVPVALTNAPTRARRVTFIGRNTNRAANTGTVWIGMLPTDDTQPIEILSGATVSLLLPENGQINLANIFLDVAIANDGVLILYE